MRDLIALLVHLITTVSSSSLGFSFFWYRLKMTNPSESEIMSPTILVDVQLQRTDTGEHDASLHELRQLIDTLGWKIAGTLTQKMSSVTAASLIGPGKLEELSELVKSPPEVDSVVFDHELTTTQVRNVREATGVDVYDRPAIILEIFHRHARTKEAQLQVELARLKYLAPRERVVGAKERRGGGRGARGVSESFHELERRQVRDRISELQRELDAVHTEQVERRRHREGLSKVAIVGYTNAGKSSLMRALTSSDVLVADQLFATLDTTVRALQPETQPRILVSDTVGFIRNLPHDLVASFRSTLDEALDASLLLHVVDAAQPFPLLIAVKRVLAVPHTASSAPKAIIAAAPNSTVSATDAARRLKISSIETPRRTHLKPLLLNLRSECPGGRLFAKYGASGPVKANSYLMRNALSWRASRTAERGLFWPAGSNLKKNQFLPYNDRLDSSTTSVVSQRFASCLP